MGAVVENTNEACKVNSNFWSLSLQFQVISTLQISNTVIGTHNTRD